MTRDVLFCGEEHGGLRCRQPASLQVAEREDAALSLSFETGLRVAVPLALELLTRQLCSNLIESPGEFLYGVILVLLARPRSPAVMPGELKFVT